MKPYSPTAQKVVTAGHATTILEQKALLMITTAGFLALYGYSLRATPIV
jgi:hypothetical protein